MRKRDRTVYGCCGAPRRTPHKPDCKNRPRPATVERKREAAEIKKLTRRVVDYEPPDGTVIRMRKMEGRWSAAMATPDGKEVQVEDGDRFWCLDLLDGRMVAANRGE